MVALETLQRKVFLLIGGGVLIICALLAGCSGSGASSEASSSDSPAVSSESAQSETSNVGGIPTSADSEDEIVDALEAYDDKFSSYSAQQLRDAHTFTLDGDEYTIPCKLSEFTANDWTLDRPSEFGGGYYERADSLPGSDEYAMFSIFKGAKAVDVAVTPANGATDWEDCTVFQIKVPGSAKAENAPSFAMKSGISLNSTAKDVLETYGCPTKPAAGVTHTGGSVRLDSLEYSQTDGGGSKISGATAKTGTMESSRTDYDDLRFSLQDGKVAEVFIYDSNF